MTSKIINERAHAGRGPEHEKIRQNLRVVRDGTDVVHHEREKNAKVFFELPNPERMRQGKIVRIFE
jgi:hypothetical protein